VFKVIEVAVREGWHADLIHAAVSYNPGNPVLQRFCEEHQELLAEKKGSASAALVQDTPHSEPTRRDDRSKSFEEHRQRTYKEMWERVERLNVDGRLQEIPDEEFSRRIAEINAFLLTSNVYIDDADRKLVSSYARAARAFHAAVRSSEDAGAKLALGDTEEIPAEVVERVRAIADAQEQALSLRASLLEKVRAVVSGRTELRRPRG
jgi:hypothetical protein